MKRRSLSTMELQSGIVYGPVQSRRLGHSLGINILPSKYKLCSFNCRYCQYGWTQRPILQPTEEIQDLPTPGDVAAALEQSLRKVARHRTRIDSLTFSGNGESTLHPDFGEIVDSVKSLRDQYLPNINLAILSNASMVSKKDVRDSLEKLDLKIMKLDAGSEALVHELNGPAPPFYLGEIVAGLKQLKDVIIQSLFVQGRVSNSDPESIELWLEKLREIQPSVVQVYTLDRSPADDRLWKVNMATLQWIVSQVRWRAGVPAELY